MQEKEIIINNKKLFYRIAGEGPAVVLLHGFGGAGKRWEHQYNTIKNFQFIVPDLPGSGQSEIIEDMSMEGLAESVYQLLQQLKVDKCTMIGHSMGGYITLAFVEKHAEMIESYGLFHSSAFADTDEKKAGRKKTIETIKENGVGPFLKTFVPGLYSDGFKQQHPEEIQNHLTGVTSVSQAAIISYLQSMIERPDRTNVLKQNKIPVLFVLGKNDSIIPFKDMLTLASMPEISYIHVLEHSGHMGMIEEPEKSNQILNKFLLKAI